MAGSLNKVMLIGNLGRDPEIRTFQSGGRVANFSIATSENWKDKNTGERQERTQWHNIVVFNEGLIGVIERFVHKGSKVYIEGQLETRKWTDQSGAEKYTTEVVLRPYRGELTMLDGRGDGAGQGGGYGGGQNYGGGQQQMQNDPGMGAPGGQGGSQMGGNPAPAGGADNLDDEIPF